MKQLINKHGVLMEIVLLMAPLLCQAAGRINDFYVSASMLSFFNFVLLIMSLICIWQYFFPGRELHTTLHVVNLISAVAFYAISISFLINNSEYYASYGCAHATECLKRIFLSLDRFSVKHWIILFGVVINVLYIIRGDKVLTAQL